ncbi:MAG: cytochrome c biogenesis protein ResB [Desulfuromonadales bacterium]|nr:cytochrome c biogenesis protein ResB [Desulfuromonadales bacterium]
MNKLKQFITARRVSLGLILLLAGLMYLSTIIPQVIDSAPENIEAWRRGHSGLAGLVDVCHLHSIYAQPWFAAIILFAALALGVSSYDQLVVVRKKVVSTGVASADELAAGIPEQLLRSVAGCHHYRFLSAGGDGQLKFGRCPWGYYGNLLLHTGLALVITVSLYVALTYRQGALILVEGEQRDGRQPWNVSEQGLLATPLKLPGVIRLDRVRVRFDDKKQPVEVFSDLSIGTASGQFKTLSASINRIQNYHGMRIYHSAQYGNAFSVTITDTNGVVHTETISAQQPVSLTKAGYSDEFRVSWSPYLLSAKYFADADKKTMSSANPELVLRLTQGNREIARTTLTKERPGTLGEYRVQLSGVARWSKLIFVENSGMPLVFSGFAIIMLGGLLQYLTPPRELIGIRQPDGRYHVYWKALSFREFFMEERDGMTAELKKGVA